MSSKKKSFQTIFTVVESKNLSIKVKEFSESLRESGSLFMCCENQYGGDGFLKVSHLDLIEDVLSLELVDYVNTIVFPKKTEKNIVSDNLTYVLWLVKDVSKMFFNKDAIRERHIWKNVEWGKRKKNYNPKGKDPGNFWLPTDDNGMGVITSHNILDYSEVVKRCVDSTSADGDDVLIEGPLSFKKGIKNRKIKAVKTSMPKKTPRASAVMSGFNNPSLSRSQVVFSSSESLDRVEESGVDLIITSPPYWDLKNYFKEGQIGQEDYSSYLKRMGRVWRESYRVLADAGSLWININNRTKNKKPILIAQDIIKSGRKAGFFLKDIFIWHKSSAIPTHKNNLVDRYEYFLWFSKTKTPYYNKSLFNEINDYKNPSLKGGFSWNINRMAGSVGKDFVHPAVYPLKLIERIILLCSKPGSVVLDPFLGSGTTLIASLKNNRLSIGYEFNEGFYNLIVHRLKNNNIDLKDVSFKGKKKSNKGVFRE